MLSLMPSRSDLFPALQEILPANPLLVRSKDLRDATHKVHSQFPWAGAVYREFSRILEDQINVFPCLFGRKAHEGNHLYFLLAGSPTEQAQLQRVCAGMMEYLAGANSCKAWKPQ